LFVQFTWSGNRQDVFQSSPANIWRVQRIFPVVLSNAMKASLLCVAGPV
jgi:hypothetical protein